MRACLQRFGPELYDRPIARLSVQVRLLKAKVIETLIYGCLAWTLNAVNYDKLQRAHLEVLQ